MILGSNITATDTGGRIKAFCGLNALFDILSMVDDAVAGYDASGRVIIANENLASLSGLTRQQLIGIDVSALFLPLSGIPNAHGRLPFPLDGSKATLLCRRPTEGTKVRVVVRARPMGDDGSFLLVARPTSVTSLPVANNPGSTDVSVDGAALPSDEVASVADANVRVASIGKEGPADAVAFMSEIGDAVVSGDASGVQDMLVSELRDAVDADAGALYVAGSGGYILRSFAGAVAGREMPSVIAAQDCIAFRVKEQLCTLAFDRHRGIDGTVVLSEKATKDVYSAPELESLPLVSFFAVPIVFDATVVALALVGWNTPHALHGHDAKVLDILALHHAGEIMTATLSARAHSNERVSNAASERLLHLEGLGEKATLLDYYDAFEAMASAVGCSFMPIFKNLHRDTLFIKTAAGELVDFPFDASELGKDSWRYEDVHIWLFSELHALKKWVLEKGLASDGILVLIDRLVGEERAFLVTKDGGMPLPSLSYTYFNRFVQDVRRLERRQTQRAQDALISHTLQSGLGNHLQHVEGLTAQAIYNSATETADVGGDFYDLIRLPGNRACVILGDVAGKGVQSASVSAAVRTALGAYSWEGLAPSHMVRSLNDFFLGFSRLETFATVFVGVIDVGEGTLTYCSAGHPPALLLHPDDQHTELLNVQSGVVGAFREMVYRDGHVRLKPGDEILLYTDGATEARSPDGSFFGELGLRDAVVRNIDLDVHDIPDKIMAMLYEFTDNRLDDDVAMMAVRYDGIDDNGEGLS
ncbi:SpoIIE family protein phosphatase [Atopobiaceae bacterium 24-176]